MKTLILTCSIIAATSAISFGQEKPTLAKGDGEMHKGGVAIRYTIDTVKYDSRTAPVRRTTETSLAVHSKLPSLSLTGSSWRTADAIKSVESQLQKHQELFLKNEYIPYLGGTEDMLKLSPHLKSIDQTEYKAEIAFYSWYNERSKELQRIKNEEERKKQQAEYEEERRQGMARLAEERRVQDSIDAVQQKEQELADAKALKERKAKLTKQYGAAKAALILDGRVELGMTRKMVIESWGEPTRQSIMSTGNGTIETLYYGGGSFLTLQNGILKGITQ